MMIKYFKNISKNSMFYNMLKMIMGSGFARTLGILSIPLLTRIYEPKDFGIASVFTSIILILAPLLSLRYVNAIPLPKSDGIAFNIFYASFYLICIFTISFTLVFYLFSEFIFKFFNLEDFSSFWWLIILGIFMVAIYELLTMWATREQKFNVIVKTKVTQVVLGEISKVVLGLLGFKPLGLLIGHTIEQSSGSFTLLSNFKNTFKSLKKNVNNKKLKFITFYYRDFPYFRLPSQFFLIFAMQAPVMIAASIYDAKIAGLMSLALMSISLPMAVFGNPIGQVFYGKIASLKKGSYIEIKKLVINIQKNLLILSLPMSIFLIFLGEYIFQIIFGSEWALAGGYAAILSPIIVFQMLSSPLIQVLNIYGSQSVFLYINIIRALGLMIIYLFFNFFKFQPNTFFIVLSCFLCFFYALCIFYVNYVVYRNAK